MNWCDRRRRIKEERYNQGLCVYCGTIPFDAGKKGCKDCLGAKYLTQKKYLQKNEYIRDKLYSLKVRDEVARKYGGKCACCGESHLAFLTIDHKNNDGADERRKLYGKQSGNSRDWYLKLRREPVREDLQVLCWNCNLAKHQFGVCPHQNGLKEPDFTLLEIDGRRKGNYGCNCKIIWPSDEDLLRRINESSCSQVARELGVHDSAIRGRLQRRGLYNQVNLRTGPLSRKTCDEKVRDQGSTE